MRQGFGLSDAFADEIADLILSGLRRRIGGRVVYVPAPDKKKRNEGIRAAFNGNNLDEVCRIYGVCRSTVYRVCGKQRAPKRG